MGIFTTIATALKDQAPAPTTSTGKFFGMSIQKIIDAIRQVTGGKTATPAGGLLGGIPAPVPDSALAAAARQLAPQRTPEDLTTRPGGPAELPSFEPQPIEGIYSHQQDIADRLRAKFEPRFAGRFDWDGRLGALHAIQAHERNAARGLSGDEPLTPEPPAPTTTGNLTGPAPAPAPAGSGLAALLQPSAAAPAVTPTLPGDTTQPASLAPVAVAPVSATPAPAPSYQDPLMQYLAAMQPMTTPTAPTVTFGYPSGDLAPLVTYDPVTGMMMLKEMAAAYNQ